MDTEPVPLVLELSILLQGVAAALALFIIPLSKRALAWFLLSMAFILMTLRRLISLLVQAHIVGQHWTRIIDPEWVALIVSVLLVAGVILIRTIFLQRNQTEDALRESEERYALAAQGSNDGLWDWNLKTNEVYFSDRWKSMLGYSDGEIGNQAEELFRRIHPEDAARFKQVMDDHVSGRSPHLEIEHRIQHKDGHYMWVLNRGLAVRAADGKATRLAGSQSDINARKDVEKQLIYDALHDKLTDLPNREMFLKRLSQAINRSQLRPGYSYAVLFIDLDRFKVLNDSRGHTVGDQMLLIVARRLESCMRDEDLVARMGGDEFTVLLEPVDDLQQLIAIAERILEIISQPMLLNGQNIYTTASIGIAPSTHTYQLPEHILRDADTAMYHAKEMGKSRYQIFNPKMHDRAVELMQLETDLRHAIDHNEFIIHYQPIMSIGNEHIVGLEALVRWIHPKRGIVSPLAFIPLAEETGLIIPIGARILRMVCRQVSDWKLLGIPMDSIKVSVNISSKQFSHPEFLNEVAATLQETGMSVNNLSIEVTESVLMENIDRASALLKEIKSMGIALHMDDFGTGYSSLSYLHKFPIDGLKIDRSFIIGITTDSENEEIVKTIIALARSLRINVTAEGIETLEQLQLMKAMGCEYGQGYYFSKPVAADQIKDLLSKPY
jgi:diguanylate cyclase (GGDEF)-like protein/PAS domain S-box-containing protein